MNSEKYEKKAWALVILIGILLWFGLIVAGIYSMLVSEDEIIGYTDHGIPVYANEVDKNE